MTPNDPQARDSNHYRLPTTYFFGRSYPVTMLLGVLLCVIAVFLILLVLVQRGRGGGLAGALGGLGGSSAFGTRAGDQFTWFTYGTAIFWILLCVSAAKWGATSDSRLNVQGPPPGAAGGPPGISAAVDAPAKDDAKGATSAAPAGEPASAGGPAKDAAAPPANPAPATSEP